MAPKMDLVPRINVCLLIKAVLPVIELNSHSALELQPVRFHANGGQSFNIDPEKNLELAVQYDQGKIATLFRRWHNFAGAKVPFLSIAKLNRVMPMIRIQSARTLSIVPVVVFSLLLAACGGGGSSTSPPVVSSSASSKASSSRSSMSSSSSAASSSSVSSGGSSSSVSSISSSSSAGTYSIGGLVGGPAQNEGVLYLAGPVSASTTSPNGPYLFSDLPNGIYTITPSSRINTYMPASIAVTLNGANVMSQDFSSVFGSFSNHSAADIHVGPSSIWFADATHGWAVSSFIIQTWNGTKWTMIDPGSVVTNATNLSAVSGSSVNDVWAVGYDGVILHWNGSTWSAMISPVGAEDFFTVWSRTANDAWIGGRSNILHWNGTSWSATPNNRSGGIGAAFDFWGSSATDIWTVTGSSILAHWDGSIWNFVSFTSQPLQSLWGFAANDVWAVGLGGFIQHWDGSVWTPATSNTSTALFNVWGNSSNDVWAGGDNGVLLHWNGSAWSSRDSETDNRIISMYGSSQNSVWIAGPALLMQIQ